MFAKAPKPKKFEFKDSAVQLAKPNLARLKERGGEKNSSNLIAT